MGKEYSYDIAIESFNLATAINRALRPYYNERYDRSNIDQLNRLSSSVSANIEESKNSKSTKELMRFYRIALKSSRESIHRLKFLAATLPGLDDKFGLYLKEMERIKSILMPCLLKLEAKSK
ncbi:MAG: four helix bundle protein [Spirochaetia bacterium]|nr:four helix bundle protein [Spirochaetia bacterium]